MMKNEHLLAMNVCEVQEIVNFKLNKRVVRTDGTIHTFK